MDLKSYIQLKEAYSQVGKPQQLTESVDSIWEEVEAFAYALVEDGDIDLSDKTWDEVREAYDECSDELLEFIKWGGGGGSAEPDAAAIAAGKKREAERRAKLGAESRAERAASKSTPASKDNYADGIRGQWQRTKDKFSGNQSRVNKATSYDASEAELRKKRVNAGGNPTDKISQKDINARTKERRTSDPNYKAGQGVDSGSKPVKKETPKTETPKTETPKTETPKTETPNTKPVQKTTQKAAPAPAKDRMAGASKADRMGAWAKANPKLAAAKAQRDSTRGTSATTNPLMKDLKNRMPKPAAPAKAPVTKPAASTAPVAKPAVAKPVAAKRPMLSKAAPKTGAAASSTLKNFASKPMKEETDFDIILSHLVEQGFGGDEALKLMVNMTEEKREEILENRRAARAAGGYKDDSKKQTDPSKDGFTGISGSIKDVMKQSAAMDKKKKQKTQKEETDSLYQAYLSMMSEEGSDKRKDSDLERKGTDARTDYSKPPGAANEWGKKKPMSDEDRSAAMAKVVAKLKKQGGK